MRQDKFLNISDIITPEHTISQEQVQLSAARPIRVQKFERIGSQFAPHDHEFYELVLVRRGTARHVTIYGSRQLRPGHFLILAPGQVHALRDCRGLAVYNIYYLAEWILRDQSLLLEAPQLSMLFLGHHLFPDRIPPGPIHVHLATDTIESTTAELELIARLTAPGSAEDSTTAVSPLLVRSALMKCLVWWEIEVNRQSPVDHQFLEHPITQHVLRCIEQSIQDGAVCDVRAWAEMLNLSADHLTRVFRAQTGETPITCYQRRRLQTATHFLIHSEETLSELAVRLGFSDSAHFTRSFRARYEMTPSDYRKRFQ